MKQLIILAFVLFCGEACHSQALVGSPCQNDTGFGSTVTTNSKSCTIGAGELLIAFASACGSACLASLPSDPAATFSGASLTWTAAQTISESFNSSPCIFSGSPACVLNLRAFWAYTGATSGTFTFTQGSSAASELQLTLLRFSGMSATPFDQATSTQTTTPGGATTITDGTLTLLSSSVTGAIDLTAGTANNAVSIMLLGFHGSGATELVFIVGQTPNATLAATQTGYTVSGAGLTGGCGCDYNGYKVVANVAANVVRKKGWVF